MAVPFSNTHLRVPRGFGTILEGLAREVLRDQPDDIPAYAAQYFDTLLKQREESGMDPAEWAAKLEDRFYNNHVFKNTQSTALKETASVTISKEQLYESQTEDESSHPAEASVLSTTQPPVSENAESTEVTDDEEINITTEEATVLAEEKQLVGDRQSVDENGSDEENDLMQTELDQIDRSENEMDVNRVLDENIPQFHPEPRENSNVNLSSLEFGVSENAGGNLQGIEHVNVENKDSDTEENSQVSDAVKTLPYSGLADVNVCAAELEVTQETKEGSTFQDNTDVEVKESTNLQHEETVAEMTLGGKQDSEDRAQKINESDKTEAEVSYEETNESLGLIEPDLDNNVTLKDDSLAETSFEDVPETQHISEDGEKKNMTDASIEILQNNVLEMQQRDESVELTAHSAGQDVAHTDHQLKPEAEIVMTEYERDVQSHQSASDFIKETVDTNSSNLNDSEDGEKKTGVKGISLSDQPTTETEKEIQEHEADHKDTEEISVETLNQNQLKKLSDDPDFDVKINTGGKDEEEKCTEPYNEMGDPEIIDGRVEQDPSSAVESNQSGVGMEAEEEIFEESPRVVGKSLPEDLKEEKNVICEEAEEYSRIKTDSVVREQTEGIEEEETISLTRSGDWTAADQEEEERPHECEDDATASANKNDKEECSRPQEEEDIMDIPLDDPEANRAAAKIQAGFRGHMTRKKMKPEDKTEGEEVSSTGDVLGSSQGVSETGRSGAVESDDTSVPEQ